MVNVRVLISAMLLIMLVALLARTVFHNLLVTTHASAEIHVSPGGNDANSGTVAKPLRTVQAAVDRLQAGGVCVVHGGTYRESVMIKQSGVVGAPIRIKAASGEKVAIDGTEILNLKWEKYKGNIYKANTDLKFRQLFFDGIMMLEARWPNMASLDDLWKESRWAVAGNGSEYGKVVDPELAATGINMSGATAVLNVYHQFYTWTRPVKEHKVGSNSFIYEKDLYGVDPETRAKYTIKNNIFDENEEQQKFTDNRYYLIGKLELLDAPGEWFLDVKTDTLYFYAPFGDDPSTHSIAVKQRDYGLSAKQQHHIQIDGVTLFACGIRFEQCDDFLLENMSVLYSSCTEEERVYKDKREDKEKTRFLEYKHPFISGNRNIIRNNLFAYGSQTGLYVHGDDVLVENNIFHDFAWLASLNHAPLRFSNAYESPHPGMNSIIRYNTIYNSGSLLLHFNGQNNLIEYNDIYNGMRAAFGGNKDVSMIYTQADVTGSKIRYNWVHDSAGGSIENKWGNGMGIRGDGEKATATRGLTVERNVIWNCGAASIMVKNVEKPTPEEANHIRNNTTFNNSTMLLGKSKVDIVLAIRKSQDENKHSIVINNAASLLSSGWNQKPLPERSTVSNNFLSEELPLTDSKNRDFRPLPESPLIDAGMILEGQMDYIGKAPDIGAYEAGASEYWIPGYRTAAASMPIIPDKAEDANLNVDLIWLQGYGALTANVYFGTANEAVAAATVSSSEFKGNQVGNIFKPDLLTSGIWYYWRIDSIDKNGTIVEGRVWSFKTK